MIRSEPPGHAKGTALRVAGVLMLSVAVALSGARGTEDVPGGSRSLRPLADALSIRPTADEPLKCGFVVLSEALRQAPQLPAETRATLGLLMLRPQLQTSVVSGMFRVHFDTTGIHTPALLDALHQRIPGSARAYADTVARTLTRVAEELAARHGYELPPSDGSVGGGPEYDVYVEELSSEYGRTTPDVDIPDGETVTSFMEIDNDFSFVYPDSNKGLPALRVTVAHEFHHAVQIGSYAYWQSEVYFHEISSVWVEELLFTEVNDYYQYLRSSSGQFRSPHVPFTTSDLIAYSRGIWGISMEKKFSPGVMRATWDACREERPTKALDATLRLPSYNSSLTAAFTDWALWNFWTGTRALTGKYYPEASAYPEMVQIPTEFIPPTTSILQWKLAPLSSRYHEILVPTGGGRTDTVTMVVNNIDLASAQSGALAPVGYSVRLSSTPVDPSYQKTKAGIYVKLDVPDPLHWSTWLIEDSLADLGQSLASLEEGMAFPNPFTPDGSRMLSIPLDDPAPVSGTLSVYTANMDRVFESGSLKSSGISRQLFSWDGRSSSGQSLPSGVYIYVLSLEGGRIITGKIALIKK